MAERVDVVVVGGGLAGIAALACLHARGVPALLLEREAELGGKVRTLRVGEALVARGPLAWEARRTAVNDLVATLGLSSEVVPAGEAGAKRYVVRDGRLRPLAPTLRSLLRTRALSTGERIALLREFRRPRGDARSESVAAFFRRRFGRSLAEHVLFAMVQGIWAGDPELLSAAACFPELVAHEREHGSVLRGVRRRRAIARAHAKQVDRVKQPNPSSALRGLLTLGGGLGRIGEQAAALLPVRTRVQVESLHRDGGGVSLVCRHGNETLHFAARCVVLAVEAPAARGLGLGPTIDARLAEFTYAPLAVVSWQEDAPGASRLPWGHGWLAPPRENTFALGTMFVSDLEGPPDQSIRRRFSTYVGGTAHPERTWLPESELARAVGAELMRLTGGRMGNILHVERVAHAVAQPVLGHLERVAALRQALADEPIVCAGSWMGAGAMRDAVESGKQAADEAVARLASQRTGSGATGATTPHKAMAGAWLAAAPTRPNGRTTMKHAKESPALVVVGAGYREAGTDGRARLARLERGDDAPSRALLRAGYADGVVVLETCARIEWIVSSTRPHWATEVLRGTLLRRVPEARLHAKTGHAGAHYLLRVAAGLDSVAEGEPAVGRQLLLAFERAHGEGALDRPLRAAWRAVQQFLGERRRQGVVQHGLGVQTLVVEELLARGVSPAERVLVFGQGEIGRAVHGALGEAGWSAVEVYRRAGMAAFQTAAREARAVVVCTGGPEPWLELPPRDAAFLIDVGVPEQVRQAPGWKRTTIEDLLARPRRLLDESARTWLVERVAVQAERLARDLAMPVPAGTLSAIDEERRVFLRETLPPLLEGLPAAPSEELRKACAAFAHHVIERVRAGGES